MRRIAFLLCFCLSFLVAEVKPMQLVIKTTSSNEEFTLGLIAGETYNATIKWGDLSSDTSINSDVDPVHVYTTAGTYTITISGADTNGFPGVCFFDMFSSRSKVYELKKWGNHTWTTMRNAFYECNNLTITATDHETSDTGSVSDFYGAFAGCSSLTTFPLINTSQGTDFSIAWADCSSLTTFPHIDTSQGTDFNGTWFGCSSLTSFPLIDTSQGTDFAIAWKNCSSLTTFPHIDTSQGTDFDGTWSGCSSLTSFPLIDTSQGTAFNNTWQNCAAVQNFPQLNLNKLESGWFCFWSVTIPTATYSAILMDMAANNPNNNVTFNGGNSRYNSAAQESREDILVGSKSWTITDGGLSAPIITSSLTANGQVNESFSYQITASENPDSFNATGLPTGLNINTDTGLISGTPTSAGISAITLTATNEHGTSPETILTLTVTEPALPVITSPDSATAVTGQAFLYTIVATNSPDSYNVLGLPANNLTIDTNTGVISGTPDTIGTLNLTLQATNAQGTGEKQLTITIENPSGGGADGGDGGGGGGGCGIGGGTAVFGLFAFCVAWLSLRRTRLREFEA